VNNINPKDFVAGPDATASDIDLDAEEFILADGTRLTEQRAEEIAAKVLANPRGNLIPGRKSLSGDGSHSPVIQFRSPRRAEAEAVARELDISLSELARRAVDAYLDGRSKTSA
jgi:hypothetical protein